MRVAACVKTADLSPFSLSATLPLFFTEHRDIKSCQGTLHIMTYLGIGALCLLTVCCLSLVQAEEKEDVPCWRGDQCSSCNNGYEGSQNGVKVCCQECYKTGLTMIGGDVCTCHMPRPTGSASSLSSYTGLLASLVMASTVRALC